jgi:hypothetical protein
VLGYALALVIGLSLGLLGGGGSILTVPVLHYVMGYGVKLAVPMSLVVVGITSGVGAIAHWRGGNLSLPTALAFAPPAIIGAVLGAQLGLKVSAELQLTVFAVVLLAAALSMWLGLAKRAVIASEAKPAGRKPLPLIALIGSAVGMLTGFVGVGGGFIYVPTLVLLGGLPMKQAIGTSLALIMVSCLAGVVRYHGSLSLDWRMIALFTAIALLGVAIGSRLVLHVSQTLLRRIFAAFLLLMGAFVLFWGR